MKQLKISFILLIVASFFAACKKDKAEPTIPIEGTWAAKYKMTGNDVEADFTLNIKQNNQVEFVDNDGNITAGTWSLTGANFLAQFPVDPSMPNGDQFTFPATFDNKMGKLINGTFSIPVSDPPITGTWYANKQ